ncbi:MAG: methyl-accepting chemotaxis protein, partial [Treponema sp.]|nr:methyl-accepting chemotaxis protein [Treponema sp.]
MKVKLSLKFFFIVAILVILSSVTICAISVLTFQQNFTNEIDETVRTAGRGGELLLQNWEQTLTAESKTIAGLNRTTNGLATDDIELLNGLVQGQVGSMDADALLIANKKGKVIAGTVGVGADISDVEAWQNVMNGENISYTWIEKDWMEWGLAYAAPVRYQGEVIGAVLSAYDFTKEDFVNLVREAHGTECTVFKGDLRVSTTLRDSKGNPMTGTRIDNQQVLSTVFGKGETIRLNNVIGGKKYRSVYIPHKNPDGRVVGMLFMAKNQHVITSATMQTLQMVIPSLVVLLIIISILTTIVVRFVVVKPVLNVRDNLLKIASGKADLTQRIQTKSKDEVGEVVGGFNAFVERLQGIIQIVKNQDKELEAGGENMGAISQDTASAITEFIANINSIHQQIESQGQSVNQTAAGAQQVSSSIQKFSSIIDSQASSVSEASAAVEEMLKNISTMDSSVSHMAQEFQALAHDTETGITKDKLVNSQVIQISEQSKLLAEANSIVNNIAKQTNL